MFINMKWRCKVFLMLHDIFYITDNFVSVYNFIFSNFVRKRDFTALNVIDFGIVTFYSTEKITEFVWL